MGDSRLLILNDVDHTQGRSIVTTNVSAFCLSSTYLHCQVQLSPDMGDKIPWEDAAFDRLGYSLSVSDVPYFQTDYLSGIQGDMITTNNTMFYRVQYTCTSRDYFTDTELVGYCTNSLSFPASLFE